MDSGAFKADARTDVSSDTTADLAAMIRTYRDRSGDPAAGLEQVAVEVRRTPPFLHAAETGSGHLVLSDEPTSFGGSGQGADPAELLLVAVATSLSVTLTAHAAISGIALIDLRIQIRGTMHAGRFFDADHHAPPGVVGVAIEVHATASVSRAEVERILALALATSPVVQSLRALPQMTLLFEEVA